MEKKLLATSNPDKIRISGFAGSIRPLFNEDAIHEKLGNPSLHGHLYPFLVSREKYLQMRDSYMGQASVLVVSDSVLVIYNNDNLVPLNKDFGGKSPDEIMERAQLNDRVEFIGSVTFGIDSQMMVSILTYLGLQPSQVPDFQLPINLSDLTAKHPDISVKKGFISYSGWRTEGDGSISRDRPFISGLIPNLGEIIDKVYKPEINNLTSLLQRQIGAYPFNTMIFYKLVDEGLSYDQIVKDWQNIFEQNGGNCSFHSLFLCHELKRIGLDPKIIVFPSEAPDHKQGHSAVVVEIKGDKYLMDPGLSVPHPLLISPFPLIYSFSSGKIVSIYEMGKKVFMEIGKKTKTIIFPQQGRVLNDEEYTKLLPKILSELHSRRPIAKVDIHDNNGNLITRDVINLRV